MNLRDSIKRTLRLGDQDLELDPWVEERAKAVGVPDRWEYLVVSDQTHQHPNNLEPKPTLSEHLELRDQEDLGQGDLMPNP